ncbi:MAG: hypothetical protein RJA63_5 [Pseudomonadota bacterium]
MYIIDILGLSPPMLFVGLAAAGIGALNAQRMPASILLGTWLFFGICCAWIGIGAVDLASLLIGKKLPESITFASVVLSGFASHPMARWVGARFPAIADAGVQKMGLNITPSSTEGEK